MLKKVIVCEDGRIDDIPENASEFVAFWQAKVDKIPIEFIDDAIIEIEACEEDGYPYICFDISYKRPETAEEMKAREDRDNSRIEHNKAHKLQQYNILKAELGL